MAQLRKDGGCMGSLRMSCGWTGDVSYRIGYCDKKPRPGRLTCWWHRFQENDAQQLKKKQQSKKGDGDASTV